MEAAIVSRSDPGPESFRLVTVRVVAPARVNAQKKTVSGKAKTSRIFERENFIFASYALHSALSRKKQRESRFPYSVGGSTDLLNFAAFLHERKSRATDKEKAYTGNSQAP